MDLNLPTNDSATLPAASVLKFMKDFASKPNQEDAFYAVDLKDISYKVSEWRRLMPRVDIFYATKCNSHETVLHTLASLGTGFDCASKGEIEKVLNLGVSPSRIIYAHPNKSKLDLQFASKVHVPLMTFDSKEELKKIKENYPQAELVLRIRCDALDCEIIFGDKFGASIEDSRSILSLARDLDLRVVGVSFHVGTSCKEVMAFRRAIASAKQVFDEGKELGMDMNLLDIGGGFLGRHSDSLEDFASVINDALDTHFPHEENSGLKVIGEPGRYIVTSAFTLATCITSKKVVQLDNRLGTNMYYINAGIYNAFLIRAADPTPLFPKVLLCKGREAKGVDKERLEISFIWGPTLHPGDFLKKDIKLPGHLEIGDWLYWPDMGAYTLETSTNFNGFPAPEVHVAVKVPELSDRQQGLSYAFEKPPKENYIASKLCALMNVINCENLFS